MGGSEAGGPAAGAAPHLVIWGTDVDVNRCKDRFKRFLERYVDANVEQDERFDGMDVEEPIYMQRLEEVVTATRHRHLSFHLSCNKITDNCCYAMNTRANIEFSINGITIQHSHEKFLSVRTDVRSGS